VRVAVNNTGIKSISLLESVVIDGSSSIPTLFIAPKHPALAAISGSAAWMVLGTGLQKTCASFGPIRRISSNINLEQPSQGAAENRYALLVAQPRDGENTI
jgi:hypothetical protein